MNDQALREALDKITRLDCSFDRHYVSEAVEIAQAALAASRPRPAREDLMRILTRYEGAISEVEKEGDSSDAALQELSDARESLMRVLQQAKESIEPRQAGEAREFDIGAFTAAWASELLIAYDGLRPVVERAYAAGRAASGGHDAEILWEAQILHQELDKLGISRGTTGSDGGDIYSLWGRVEKLIAAPAPAQLSEEEVRDCWVWACRQAKDMPQTFKKMTEKLNALLRSQPAGTEEK